MQTILVTYGDHQEEYPDLHTAEADARRKLESGTAIRRAVILEKWGPVCVLRPLVTVQFRVVKESLKQPS